MNSVAHPTVAVALPIMTATPTPTSQQPTPTPSEGKCCVCLYSAEFISDCNRWMNEQTNCSNSYSAEISDSHSTYANSTEMIQTVCGELDTISAYFTGHGTEDDTCVPFDSAEGILSAAPDIDSLDLTVDACLMFDNLEAANQAAEGLRQSMQESGCNASVSVTSNQNITRGYCLDPNNSQSSMMTYRVCQSGVCEERQPCHSVGSGCTTDPNTLDTFSCKDSNGANKTQVCVANNGNENNNGDGSGTGTWQYRN